MPKKLAIDWDEAELRIVVGNCSGTQVTVTHAAVLPLESTDVFKTLRTFVSEQGLEKNEALVAIGRGKAELRELQLPPVPDEELPDIVRFQAIRNFASAGDSASIDYLITSRSEQGVKAIAAAVAPDKLAEIKEVCSDAELQVKRIALRPLAAAALFLSRAKRNVGEGDTVLVDLLNDDAEIIVVRDGNVIFVRTVRIAASETARPRALVGELRRSLMACGASGTPKQVVLWGRESVHKREVDQLAEATGAPVEMVNPFDLVDVDRKTADRLPEHVGRLAPLVGLLACDEVCPERLIDFLNPRQRLEEKPSRWRTAAIIGIPVAAALLMGYLGYRQLRSLDSEIEQLSQANAGMKEQVDAAIRSVARTEKVDEFLDADANWLDELQKIAAKLPPSHEVMLKSVVASSDLRTGVSTVTLTGSASDQSVIEKLEEAIRDDDHSVVGEGASEQEGRNAYRWVFTEKISMPPDYAHRLRYEGIQAANEKQELPSTEDPNPAEEAAETAPAESIDSVMPSPEVSSEPPTEAASEPLMEPATDPATDPATEASSETPSETESESVSEEVQA
ncbi:type IV pilus biogenesis protein PilM [Novipirellula artificiosorum]|uniref:Competence protein A n=1 Tax=Novipirellula artificiosorum TaxID=2528016 RepID=A0A5C6DZ27_9BACT|nr:hypothetical protein [Novipirellula artificiosorum]TWU41900.1 Competence protein A [Novipirellula artificiosorum]